MKQSERSKQWIIDALFELMKTKSYQEITIKDLTEKAGVARLTFYRNFETKEDVLVKHFENMFAQYLNDLNAFEINTAEDALTKCFEYWKKNKVHIELFTENHLLAALSAPFGNYLETMINRYDVAKSLTVNQKQFLVGGLFFSMLEWISNEEEKSAREVAHSILEMLKL
ncbi:TetR/AcrR family transcriptional regulator [Parasporobacterium paucivorans]|uniref:Transcriptional regulator, TetR family n=1 Tax=Parasporobacterium paucivorans DSM 15970 TaxID=1122934 RepID=A0A1M6KUD1_9FIRM|nr:TetR/AcrR family transcriptional regulator [Parasporobacterium paucivorans]SHJ62519.1 transcriptional regulator, TetR family [Parasporobacterium paucivorans DSM 15970]